MRTCTKCGTTKPPDSFHRDKRTTDGLTYWCKACYAAYYEANRDHQIASARTSRLRRSYGLNVEQYEALVAGGCTVCGSHVAVVIDHCHATKLCRGALCRACNLALGAVGDRAETLRALADYLDGADFIGTTGSVSPSRYNGPEGDELRRLYEEDGLSINAIAKAFHVSPSSVRDRVHALGVTVRPTRRPLDEAEMVRLYVDEKWSLEEVASRFSMSSGGIRKRLIACGVAMRSAGGVSHASRLRA